MRRGHRRAHLALWVILAPLMLLGLYLGLRARSVIPAQEAPVAEVLPESNPPATPVNDL